LRGKLARKVRGFDPRARRCVAAQHAEEDDADDRHADRFPNLRTPVDQKLTWIVDRICRIIAAANTPCAALRDALEPPTADLLQRGRQGARQRDWAVVADALLAVWGQIAESRAVYCADDGMTNVDSPISGLPTRSLVRSSQLRTTGDLPALMLGVLADGRPLPQRALSEAWRLCANGASLGELRCAIELEPEDVDDVVLELLRFGTLARGGQAP
jgi:hypothetical protein